MRRRWGPASTLAAMLLVGSACGDATVPESATPTSPPLTARGVELQPDVKAPDAEQLAALAALSTAPGSPPIVTPGESGHDHHGPVPDTDPPSADLEAQLETARAAAHRLMQHTRLSDVGYYLGSYYSRGIGTHYIDWRLVGAPFDPARPAMLLVDSTDGHRRRLAGFSYWVGSHGPPDGFAGGADQWHNHRGLCFVDGVMARENVADPARCEGHWIDGEHLWMLHVWIVPGYENPDGVFAARNPKLCPPRTGLDAGFC